MGESDEDMSAIAASKAALRKSLKGTLRGLTDADIEIQSQTVARHLFQSRFFREARSIGCYLSMPKAELRTTHIVDEILKKDTTLYTPYIPPRPKQTSVQADPATLSRMRMLRLYTHTDLEACPRDGWMIPDPGLSRRDVEDFPRADVSDPSEPPLDIVLVPGVAFDEECNRLGHGKGYYDFFLRSYTSSRPSPLLVGLALDCQVLRSGAKVPTTDTDYVMDTIISPKGIIWRDNKEH